MTKIQMTAQAQFDLRQALHVATLDALLASRRWLPGELIFQGGTSLHLAHGSPRFSEDLDFLVHSTLNLEVIGQIIQERLAETAWLPSETSLTVTKANPDRNPHTFVVAVSGPNVIGSVRVKVELWQASKNAMSPLRVIVAPVKLASGPNAGAQAFVPTADLNEIYTNKVFAVGARRYMKPRDLFDLNFILGKEPNFVVTEADLRVRLATYPNESPDTWLEKARLRADALPLQVQVVTSELRRWLPSSWPMDMAAATKMIETSVKALSQGIGVMEAISIKDTASGAFKSKFQDLTRDALGSEHPGRQRG